MIVCRMCLLGCLFVWQASDGHIGAQVVVDSDDNMVPPRVLMPDTFVVDSVKEDTSHE